MQAAAPNARVTLLDVPPVVGALIEALVMAGAADDAQGRARAAFR